MKLQRFDNPEVFQDTVQDFLIENEAENNLPLGVLAGVISGEYTEKTPYMGLVEDKGIPILVMMCTPPYPVLFTYKEKAPSRPVLSDVLIDLKEELGEDFTGITGNKSLSAEIIQVWKNITGGQAEIKFAMRIYKLEQVKPVDNVPGLMRSITIDDKLLLQNWYAGFHREALVEEPDPARVEKQVTRYLSSDPMMRGLKIWEVDGEPVSMAGYAGPTPNGVRVGAVYTPPEQRKKGFASAVTAGVSQYLLGRGFKFCFLFTDLLNPTSNHIYQQIGYKPVCDVDRYDFKINLFKTYKYIWIEVL